MDNTSSEAWNSRHFLVVVALLQMTMSRTMMSRIVELQLQLAMVVVVDLTIVVTCCLH